MPAKPGTFSAKKLFYIIPAGVFAATVALATQSVAEGYGNRLTVQDKATKTECGACHMPYPAALMSADAWRAIMSDLPNHFGEDASLDEKTRKHIEDYLVSHTRWQTNNNSLRISDQEWFKRRHRYEVSNRMFQHAKSWANCPACHTGATQGFFGEGVEEEGE